MHVFVCMCVRARAHARMRAACSSAGLAGRPREAPARPVPVSRVRVRRALSFVWWLLVATSARWRALVSVAVVVLCRCDVVKLAMIKTERLARKLFGGSIYDCVCVFEETQQQQQQQEPQPPSWLAPAPGP